MKKIGIAVALTLCTLLIGSDAQCAAWTSPNLLKIVQKDQSSGTNTYTTITNALNAITNNSSSNRYLIKVMPGTYTQTVPLQMKSWVDIEGSGQENTIITSALPNAVPSWEQPAPTQATVVMAANSKISNLRIENTSGTGGIALLIKAGSAQAEDVTIVSSGVGDSVFEHDYYAVVVNGAAATGVVLRNVTATASTPHVSPSVRTIALHNGSVTTIDHSRVFGSGGSNTSCLLLSYKSDLNLAVTATVRDMVCDLGPGDGLTGLDCNDEVPTNVLTVDHSKVVLHDAVGYRGMQGGTSISHSEVRVPTGLALEYVNMVTSTLIQGGLSSVGTVTNCWNENGVPIPNYP